MLRENIKWKSHKIESTKVVNRGRLNRSSEEVSVMEMERRDLHNNGLDYGNIICTQGQEE